MLLSFALCLGMFLLIGVLSIFRNRHTTVDYLVTGHNTAPWMVALSAVATNNSGYMFVGMIGYTYTVGFASIWLMIGWILGDFFTSLFVHRRLRQVSEQYKKVSYPGGLSQMVHARSRWFPALGGVITLLFLSTYAAAQLAAGGKSLQVLFGWDFRIGAAAGALIVLIYCFVGGIRASFWTDIAQSIVMIVAMASLCVVGIEQTGGWNGFVYSLRQLEPQYMYWFPSDVHGIREVVVFLLGWLGAGVAVVGQPHIMLRFLALDNPKHIRRVRVYYYSWYTAFYGVTIVVGMLARLLLPDVGAFDPELALPKLAIELLPPVMAGLVIAGLFAATMSTADSQIMACSATVTHDFRQDRRPSYWAVKAATISLAAFALIVAVWGHRSVFYLVLLSWSALGSAFAPLAMLAAAKKAPGEKVAGLMILAGLSGAVVGKILLPYAYEVLPGMAASFAVYLISVVYSRAKA